MSRVTSLLAGATAVAVLASHSRARAQQVDPKPWITDGPVNAMALAGNALYIGGQFTYVGPYTGSGAPVDAASGQISPGFPIVDGGSVLAAVPDGQGGWFIGGVFDSVGGKQRQNLAQINSDLSVGTWNPGATGAVYALALSGSQVYVGGAFESIGSVPRRYIAALNAATGQVRGSWNVTPNGVVFALIVRGNTVYASGAFTIIGAQFRNHIVAVNASSGLASAWNPNSNADVVTLAAGAGTVYAGGYFNTIGGQPRGHVAALDSATGLATAWNPGATGPVYTLAASGSAVYAGGAFAGIGGQSRSHVAALDAGSGQALAWDPGSNGDVLVLAVVGSTLYAGGDFTSVGGQPRGHAAALDAATGDLAGWNPNAGGGVRALVVTGGTVYVGGNFVSIGGRSRGHVAALDRTTGQPTAWNPNANGDVSALAVSGGAVYAGGSFTTIGGQARGFLAALDAATGDITPWDPQVTGMVYSLAVGQNVVYAGGDFTSAGGQARNRIAALDAAGGLATAWDPNADGVVRALAVGGGVVYAGGDFTNAGGQSRSRIAALDAGSGMATPWNPGANNIVRALAAADGIVFAGGDFTTIGDQVRIRIGALDVATGQATEWDPNAGDRVRALALAGGKVYGAGDFTTIGLSARNHVAALDVASGQASPWSPSVNGAVNAVAEDAGTVYVGGDFTSVAGQPRTYLAAVLPVPFIQLMNAPRTLPTVTIGDTALGTIAIRNPGTGSLTVSTITVPSAQMTLTPGPPLVVPPDSTVGVTLRFAPRVAEQGTDSVRIASDDATNPAVVSALAYEALDLAFVSAALTASDSAALGEAVTVRVIPGAGRRFEGGGVYHRARGGTVFEREALVQRGSTWIGIIPGVAVREGGIEYYVEVENSGLKARDPATAPGAVYELPVRAPVTLVAVPRPTSRTEFVAGREIEVEAVLPVGAEYAGGVLHYRRGGERDYASEPLTVSGPLAVPVGRIPAERVGARGVEYWVEVETRTAQLMYPAGDAAGSPAGIRTTVASLTEERTHPGRRYRLLGVPLDFGAEPPRLDGVLSEESEFGLYEATRWRAYRYEAGANVEFAPGDDRFRLVPGRAFWLISREGHRVDTAPVTGLSTATGVEYGIALEPGWNAIANPFAFGVAWESVRRSAAISAPVAFDETRGTIGDYDPVEPAVLEPFEGYFVRNEAAQAETLWVPAVEAPVVAARTQGAAESAGGAARGPVKDASALAAGSMIAGAQQESWRITVRASRAGAEDGANELGVDGAASDGWDALDRPKPPAPPGAWVRVSLEHPEWEGRAGAYRRDLRAAGVADHAWELEVMSAVTGEALTLELVPEGPLPAELTVALIDREQGSVEDLGSAGHASYRILSPGPGRAYRLTVLAGSAEYVSGRAGLAVPREAVLEANAPNPFTAVTRLRFGLARAGRARLEIYNLLGERVATPLAETVLPAGYHALLWDGISDEGRPTPSGVYFYRLTLPERVLSRRMVLVR